MCAKSHTHTHTFKGVTPTQQRITTATSDRRQSGKQVQGGQTADTQRQTASHPLTPPRLHGLPLSLFPDVLLAAAK